MNPLISVLVPLYNAERYLVRCIESILGQTYSNLEILLIDDGSKDASGKISDDYAKQDGRIRVIHQENKGVAAARNLGLRECTGTYITFVDADDILLPKAIEAMYDRILLDNSQMVLGKISIEYPDGSRPCTKLDWMCDTVLGREEALGMIGGERDLPCVFWGKLYTRSLIADFIVPDLLRGEDTCAFPFILDRCERISVMSEYVYRHIRYEGSLTYSASDPLRLAYVRAVLPVARFYLEKDMMKNASDFFTASIFHAMNMQDIEPARRIICDSFTPAERRMLLRKNFGSYVRWYAVCHTWFYKFIMNIKRIRDRDPSWMR